MALLASVVLIVSENIGIETSTGTKYIVNAASGKNTVKIKRIAASLALCIVLYFIVYGIDDDIFAKLLWHAIYGSTAYESYIYEGLRTKYFYWNICCNTIDCKAGYDVCCICSYICI
ncbi:MAG: hypothetical protein ACLTAT_11035 [Lachnospira eligens]